MHRRRFFTLALGAALCPACRLAPLHAAEAPHFDYEGDHGPAKWGELAPEFRTCAVGTTQSPIDIHDPIGASLPKLTVSYPATIKGTILNNGHTIQVNPDAGTLQAGRTKYTLAQFHFHRPSEHTFAGKASAMEVHFVHKDDKGQLGVLGALIEEGKANSAFESVLAQMPMHEGPAVALDPAKAIDMRQLLPAKRAYYRYSGSLTTPPCSELVDWMVLATTITASKEQIAKFAALYPLNARPIQPENRRLLLQGS